MTEVVTELHVIALDKVFKSGDTGKAGSLYTTLVSIPIPIYCSIMLLLYGFVYSYIIMIEWVDIGILEN